MKIKLLDQQTAYAGFYRLRRLTLMHERYDGKMTPPLVREVVERSDALRLPGLHTLSLWAGLALRWLAGQS
jgi:hypothetical protein